MKMRFLFTLDVEIPTRGPGAGIDPEVLGRAALRQLQGHSIEEICDEFGRTPRTMRRWLSNLRVGQEDLHVGIYPMSMSDTFASGSASRRVTP